MGIGKCKVYSKKVWWNYWVWIYRNVFSNGYYDWRRIKMDENIKYELAEAEKLEVIDNAGVAENEKKSIVTVLLSLSCCGHIMNAWKYLY